MRVASCSPARLNGELLILGTCAFLLFYLVGVPLATLLWGSFRDAPPGATGAYTIKNYLSAYLENPAIYRSLGNTLLFSLSASGLALLIGTLLAWLTERTNMPGKKAVYALTLFPLIIPGILTTIAWVFLLSPRIGALNRFLAAFFNLPEPPFNIYGLGGMIWVQALHEVPLSFLLMASSFRSMDPSLEEASFVAGAGNLATARRITLKLNAPAFLATLLINFSRSIETFEVPAVIGMPEKIFVLATEIYLATRMTPIDFGLASSYASLYLGISTLGVLLYLKAVARSERYATITGRGFKPAVIDLGGWRYLGIGLSLGFLFLALFLPLLMLLWVSLIPFYQPPSWKSLSLVSSASYVTVVQEPLARIALWNNLVVGGFSATAVMSLTVVVAWIVVRTAVPGRKVLDVLAYIPIAFPGIVVGLSLMWVYLALPLPLYGTVWILVIAFVTKSLPFGMRSSYAALLQIHKELEDASRASGADWWNTFKRIILPLLMPGFLAGWVYVFAITFKALSTPILLGQKRNAIIPVLIWDLWEGGQYSELAALGVMLILLIAVVSIGFFKFRGEIGVVERYGSG